MQAANNVLAVANRYGDNQKFGEAALLLSVAEGHLEDEEDPNCEEALKAANQAKDLFSVQKSVVGTADSLRLVVLATKAKGDRAEAERLAKSGIEDFKNKKESQAQAIMILALAEVGLDRTNKEALANEESVNYANEAAELFRKLGDARDIRMEACCYITVANLQHARKAPKEALEAANKAVQLAQEAGDMVVAAKASHKLGEAHILNEEVGHVKNGIKNGIQAFKNSLAIYQDLGMRQMAGYELYDTARCMLKCLHKPKTVNTLGHQAYQIFKELGKAKAAISCLELLVQASVKYKDFQAGTKDAFEGVMYFKGLGAQKELARAWATLTEVHIAEGKADTAVDAIGNAVTIAKTEKDQALLLTILKLKGKAHCANRAYSDASETLAEAQELAKECEDKSAEASVLGCMVDVGIASGDIEDAVQAAEDQREIYQRLGSRSEEAASLLMSATCIADKTTDKSQVGRALTRAKEARSLAKDAKDPKVEGSALLLISKLCTFLENEDDAVEASEDMLRVLKHVAQADKALGEACSQLAKSYMEMGSSEEAAKHADQASAFAKRSEDPMFEAETMIMVAEVNYGIAIRCEQDTRKGQQKFHKCAGKAWQSAKLAKARCERFKYKDLLPKALCAMGEVGVVFDADLASKSAEEAQNLSAELEDDLGVATAVILQANILYHKGQNSSAMAERGLRLADEAGAPDLVIDAQDIIDRTSVASPHQVQEVAAVVDKAPVAAAGASLAVAAPEKAGLDPAMVTEVVTRVATQSIASDEDLEMDTPLMDAGLDSLSSVAFRNTLMNELKMKMPAALMFDYPNIRQLTDFIVETSSS